MRIGGADMLFVWGVLVRLSPDSACTKNAITKMIASQKIPRTAFNLFILLFLLLRASLLVFRLHRDQTAADALRFSARDIAQELREKASRIFSENRSTPTKVRRKK
jgi:hypothetical protein